MRGLLYVVEQGEYWVWWSATQVPSELNTEECNSLPDHCLCINLGGVTRVTGAAAYFMLLLCARLNSQTLKFHSPVSPDPLNARLLGFPESPPRKYPRSANDWLDISQIKHMETLLCRGQMASKSV